ncbi:DnaJ family domain-containing protein [Desulfobulbus propionicus]
MLSILQQIAERKILQAMEEGTLPDLSHWKNKPLPQEDLSNVPADLRMAYRLLKNAGYVPEEVALRKEITQLEQLLETCRDEKEKVRQLKKIGCLKTKLECRMGRSIELGEEGPYYGKVVDRLATPKKRSR